MLCAECNTLISRHIPKGSPSNHFCSRSCAASFNNRKHPKRHPEGNCRHCSAQILTCETYCSETCKDADRATRYPIPPMSPDDTKRQKSLHVIEWQRRTKKRALGLLGGCCQVCGYSKATSAMVFHHIDPSQKEFSISGTIKSWARVEAELKKCALLCNRCHIEVHRGLTDLGG